MMTSLPRARSWIALTGASAVAASTASALVKFNDGKDQIFVTGQVGMSWDSNIFAQNGGDGDYAITSALDLEYTRRAGMIGVNAGIGWDFSKFTDYSDEDFANPHANLELTKDSGRTTGSFTLSAQRQSRADSAANIRTELWDYSAGLSLKYPVIERYSIAGTIGYGLRDYSQNTFLVDLTSYTAAVDLFYVWTTERDLIGGYRYRFSETSADTQNHDHAFTVGVSGKIIPKLAGTARFGYQIRNSDERLLRNGVIVDERHTYDSWTASAATTWSATKKLSVTALVSKDFSTTSTNISVDSFNASLDIQYAVNAKLAVFGSVGYGESDFLGALADGRHDTYFTWSAGVAYTMNDHLKANLSYAYFHNWSTFDYADFDRSSINLNLSSRW